MKQQPGVTGSLSPEEGTISPRVISLHYINESKGSIWGNNEKALNRAVRCKQFRNQIVLMGLKGPIINRQGTFSQHFQVIFSQWLWLSCFLCLWLIHSGSIYFVYRFNIWHYPSKELIIFLCLLFPLLLQSRADGKPIINDDTCTKRYGYVCCFSLGPQWSWPNRHKVGGASSLPEEAKYCWWTYTLFIKRSIYNSVTHPHFPLYFVSSILPLKGNWAFVSQKWP